MPTSYTVHDDADGNLWAEISDHRNNTSMQYLGSPTYLSNVWRVLEDGSIILELEYEYMGITQKIKLPRGDLKKSELVKYASQGLNATESNAKYVVDFITLQEAERDEPPKLIHRGVGMDVFKDDTRKGKHIFKGHRAIGVKSEYIGDLVVKPKGTLEMFKAFAQKYIIDNPLSLAVAFGLSAIVVGFLGDRLQTESLVIHLSGESTTGKSTATRLAVSMGSLPSFLEPHTLMNTFDGTENALLATLLYNFGFPACFDEADANDRKDLSQFIYRMTSGREKKRLTKEGHQKATVTYRTTILTNGEKRLTANSNQNTGKEIRVLSFDSISWTKSATHAETVNHFVTEECYAVPIYYLARHMLKLGINEVLKRYEANRKLFISRSLVNDSFTARASGKYAFILTATELANECMDLCLPFETILDALVQNEAETQDNRDIAKKAYDYLMEQFNVNIDKFSLASPTIVHHPITGSVKLSESSATREVWGIRIPQNNKPMFNGNKCIMNVCIAKEKCEELLRKGGFQEPKVVFKKFKERQWLDCENDRYTRTRKIKESGTAVTVYAIRIFEAKEDEFSPGESTGRVRKPIQVKEKPIENLA
ncbi:MAG: DUF927 domain-containing protein [Defluviitaleaceae bacterium]|nr:DUF927 domain-containing protein [Defluviitaleaceae bacterium]